MSDRLDSYKLRSPAKSFTLIQYSDRHNIHEPDDNPRRTSSDIKCSKGSCSFDNTGPCIHIIPCVGKQCHSTLLLDRATPLYYLLQKCTQAPFIVVSHQQHHECDQ